jgi:hypothetical protein
VVPRTAAIATVKGAILDVILLFDMAKHSSQFDDWRSVFPEKNFLLNRRY